MQNEWRCDAEVGTGGYSTHAPQLQRGTETRAHAEWFLALKIAAAPCHCGVWRDLALALLARPWPCRPDFDDSSDEAVDGIVRGSLTLIWRVEACSWGGRGQVCQVSRVSWFQRLTTTRRFLVTAHALSPSSWAVLFHGAWIRTMIQDVDSKGARFEPGGRLGSENAM